MSTTLQGGSAEPVYIVDGNGNTVSSFGGGSGGDASAANQVIGNASLAAIDAGTPAALGPTVAANAMPVWQAGNVTAATTLQNAAGANGNGVAFDVTGYPTAIFRVSGLGVATINFEIDDGSGTWVPLLTTQLGANVIANSTAANGFYRASVAGMTQVRARISGWASGAITVVAVASSAIAANKAMNAILYGKATVAGDTAVLLDSSGRHLVAGAAAAGAAVAGNPVLVGGKDTAGNAQAIFINTQGVVILGSQSVPSDGVTNALQPIDNGGVARPMAVLTGIFNGTSWDRQRGVSALTLLASAARTVTTNSADQTNYNWRGIILMVDVSVIGTGSITPSIQIKDSISGNYKTVWTAAAALVGNGTAVYALYPSAVAASFTEAAAIMLPRTWRLALTSNNANAVTASASADMML